MKDLKNLFYSILSSIATLGPIPRLFYITLFITFWGITAYKALLKPFTILFLGILFLTFYIKDLLYRSILVKYFETVPKKNFFESIDPLSLLIPIGHVILNPYFEYSIFLPVIIWSEPFIIRRFIYSKKEKLISNFLSSIIHLFLLILGVFLIISLQKYKIIDLSIIFTKLSVFNLKNLFSYSLFYFSMFNLTYLIMNMIPISPFDMGIALENIGKSALAASINNIGNILIFFLYYIDVVTYIADPIYKFFIFKFLINHLK